MPFADLDSADPQYAVQVVDRSVVQMAHWLLRNEGLFVGSSSALNIWAAAQVARNMSPGARVVTLACDGGQRYQSRLFDDSWLAAKDLAKKEKISEDGYRLVVNNGRNAGQAVFHLHYHLLGGRKFTWPPG